MFGFKRWRFARRVKAHVAVAGLAAAMSCAAGCGTLGARNDEISYHGEAEREWYVGEATKVAHSNFVQETPDDVRFASAPRTIADRRDDVVRELSLGEVIHIALMNNKIVQTGINAPVGGKAIYGNPDNIPSVYDQAIRETGVLFGGRGVEAALSDFDATVQTSLTWGRSSTPINGTAIVDGLPVPGATSNAETANYSSTISKQFATGASLQFFNNWSYLGTNSQGVLFPSSYTGNSGVAFRQPLLAGSGADFTRIAGPVNPNFGAITGVSQGVLIARINSDITLAGFEASVRDSIRDVQKAYWALYLAYRNYETSVVSHRSAHQTWKEASIRLDVGTLKAADEAQALEQFYATQANVEQSLSALYTSETNLRRLLGLQLNDGEIIRPSDKPMVANFKPDWRSNLAEALTRRVEIRRQKWNIKSLQLQLRAARSLVRPQLDFVAGAQASGFGDDLLGSRTEGVTDRGLGSGFGSLLSRDFGSWNAGFEFSVPLGFRSAHAQVRNYELRVAKARAVLSQTEREIAHDITLSIESLVASYTSASTNEERLIAARRRVELLDLERQEGTTTLDLVLRAQTALAQAESQYYQRVIDFSNAMIDLEYSKGSLLASSGIQLAEGGWDACAYDDAIRRACERTYAMCNDHLDALPEPFASPTPLGSPGIAELPYGDDLPHYDDGPEILIPSDEDQARPRETAPPPPGSEDLDSQFPGSDAPDLEQPDIESPDAPDLPDTPDLPDLPDLPDIARFGSGWESIEIQATSETEPAPIAVQISDRTAKQTPPIPEPTQPRSVWQLGHQSAAQPQIRFGDAKKTVRASARPQPIDAVRPGPDRLLPEPRVPDDSFWETIPGPFDSGQSVPDNEPRPLPPRNPEAAPVTFDDLFGPPRK